MNEPPVTLTIGVLAEAAGVNVETIRFYQRKGLMQEPDRPQGGIRRYGEADLARVRFIKSAQRLGFSLDEIGDLLESSRMGRTAPRPANMPNASSRMCAPSSLIFTALRRSWKIWCSAAAPHWDRCAAR